MNSSNSDVYEEKGRKILENVDMKFCFFKNDIGGLYYQKPSCNRRAPKCAYKFLNTHYFQEMETIQYPEEKTEILNFKKMLQKCR